MKNDVDKLWVEKYRPKKIQDLILSEENSKIIEKFILNDEIPNLLFYGNAGTGKTTLAKILVDTIDAEHLFLNCSEVGIDVVRTTITQFSQTKSFNGKKKVVICDEIDGSSSDAQRGLRNTMEENSGYCRYILTCNFLNRVISPLQSRCQSFLLVPPITGIVKRMGSILKEENILIDENSKKGLISLVKKLYPDTRKIINEIQKYCIDNKLTLTDNSIKVDNFAKGVIDFILKKNILEGRRYVIENETEFNGDYTQLFKSIFDYITENSLPITQIQKKMWLITIGEYLYRNTFVVDSEINFYCLMLALSEISNS
jgi:DNA polymerase III delta prime subunit